MRNKKFISSTSGSCPSVKQRPLLVPVEVHTQFKAFATLNGLRLQDATAEALIEFMKRSLRQVQEQRE